MTNKMESVIENLSSPSAPPLSFRILCTTARCTYIFFQRVNRWEVRRMLKTREITTVFLKCTVSTVPHKLHLISGKWGHSVSSLAHNIQSPNPNVLSRALLIICNCSMKETIILQWNTLLTSGWAGITNLFPGDQLKWTITIFLILNNS